jgi:hypothetical protein
LKTDYSYALANLKKLKPYYSNCQRAVGVSKANALFPPSKEEIADMLEEFKELEAATISDIVNSGLLD